MRVFYLDDDIDEVLLFSEAVHEIDPDIDFEGLTDSTEALRQLHLNPPPDVIFLDFNMPGLTGEDCLEYIQQLPNYQNVPIVIYSTGVDDRLRQRLLRKGAAMVVNKHGTTADFKIFFRNTFLSHSIKPFNRIR